MANSVCHVLVTAAPLSLPAEPPTIETGAIIDFWGVVRATEGAEQISGIRYEAHPVMAEHQLQKMAEECLAKFALPQLVVHHRIGFVPVGDASLLVRVGSQHRAEGFRASVWIVDELKKRVPIWKHPVAVATLSSAALPT